MSRTVSGTYIASDAAVKVEVGFVPDKVRLTTAIGGTELVFDWLKVMGDTSALTGQYGIKDAAGAKTHATTAATGIIAYDEVANKVLLPAPNGEGEEAADVPLAYTLARSDAATARSTTALGTILKPSSGNETGYIYECTTDGTSTGEPTWGTVPGEIVTDGTTKFITREEKVFQGVAKGFEVGVDICTNGEIHAFTAELHDASQDMGDADNTNPVRLW